MGNKHLNLATGMQLEDGPLVYLHEHFKEFNDNNHPNLTNNWVWFSKKDLKAIRKGIKKIKKDDPKKNGDGVRIYYGIYNKRVCELLTRLSKEKPNTPRDYSDHVGHNTVLFVPTYEGTLEGEHIDCISQDSAGEYKEAYKRDEELPHSFTGGFNVGNICPPPKPCPFSGSHL